jgi:hypothetical protein
LPMTFAGHGARPVESTKSTKDTKKTKTKTKTKKH